MFSNQSDMDALCMDKTMLFAGVALPILGTCFLTAQSIENSLSGAFPVGGYLWLVLAG